MQDGPPAPNPLREAEVRRKGRLPPWTPRERRHGHVGEGSRPALTHPRMPLFRSWAGSGTRRGMLRSLPGGGGWPPRRLPFDAL